MTTTIDRHAEATRYRRWGRTTDRLDRLTAGRIRKYRGRYAHEWHALANATHAHFCDHDWA